VPEAPSGLAVAKDEPQAGCRIEGRMVVVSQKGKNVTGQDDYRPEIE
jgi:hypothetical protein